jgi:hypothetical protein
MSEHNMNVCLFIISPILQELQTEMYYFYQKLLVTQKELLHDIVYRFKLYLQLLF